MCGMGHTILVERPEIRRPLGRPRRRWDDKIKIDLRKVVWEGIDWIKLGQLGTSDKFITIRQ
jgi:hypothetical protein